MMNSNETSKLEVQSSKRSINTILDDKDKLSIVNNQHKKNKKQHDSSYNFENEKKLFENKYKQLQNVHQKAKDILQFIQKINKVDDKEDNNEDSIVINETMTKVYIGYNQYIMIDKNGQQFDILSDNRIVNRKSTLLLPKQQLEFKESLQKLYKFGTEFLIKKEVNI